MSFRKHLAEEMKSAEFQKAFEEEKRLLQSSYAIVEAREKSDMTQKNLRKKAMLHSSNYLK